MLPLLWLLDGRPAFAADGLAALEIQVLGARPAATETRSRAERLARLESILGLPPDARLSESYRLNRLIRRAAERSAAERSREAIALYNRGVDAEAAGHPEAAMAAYRQALQADPGLIQAYNNLGNLLLQAGRTGETAALYRQGLAVQPEAPLLRRNLGLWYERQGRIIEAVAEYERYLSLAKQPDPPIEAIVSNFRANRRLVEGVPDYLPAATESSGGHRLLWDGGGDIVRVYVRQGRPEQGFVLPVLRGALDTWTRATDGRLRFELTDAPEMANIRISLRDEPLSQPVRDIGHTEYHLPGFRLRQGRLARVTITLNVGEPGKPAPDLADRLTSLALHEIGHAIGIWGHSPSPDDVMFAHPVATALSARDIRTVRLLYGLPVDAANLNRRQASVAPATQTAPTSRIMR